MMRKSPLNRNHYLSFIGLGLMILLAFASIDDESTDSASDDGKNRAIPMMTEEEYVKYFQSKWDSVKLTRIDEFPQYMTYHDELDAVHQDMLTVLERDSLFKYDSPSKLNKMRLRLIESKKYKTATKNWILYGQPISGYDLKSACEFYLEQNANDPSSIEIEDWKIAGQSKTGWIVILKYRGRNAFGGLVLNVSRFDVRFDPAEKYYYVKNMYNY